LYLPSFTSRQAACGGQSNGHALFVIFVIFVAFVISWFKTQETPFASVPSFLL